VSAPPARFVRSYDVVTVSRFQRAKSHARRMIAVRVMVMTLPQLPTNIVFFRYNTLV
jgi:hypothetical protein